MSTPEPPDRSRSGRDESTPDHPTEPLRPDAPGGTPASAAAGRAGDTERIGAEPAGSTGRPDGEPAAGERDDPGVGTHRHAAGEVPAGTGPGDRDTAAASTGAASPGMASTGMAPARRRFGPRPGGRRWPWITGGAVAGVLLLAVVFGLGVLVGHHGGRDGYGRHGHGPGGWRHHAEQQRFGPGDHADRGEAFGRPHRMRGGELGGPAGEFGGPGGDVGGPGAGRGPGPDGGPGGPGGFGGRGGGVPPVVGTVSAVNGADLVLAQDSGAPVTVTTTPATRVVGEQRGAVSQLLPGDRVAVAENPQRQAVSVRLVPATAVGTVASVNGDQAVLVGADGLTRAVDVSAATTKPVPGDRVAVRGTATGSGTVLKAQSLVQLPKAG